MDPPFGSCEASWFIENPTVPNIPNVIARECAGTIEYPNCVFNGFTGVPIWTCGDTEARADLFDGTLAFESPFGIVEAQGLFLPEPGASLSPLAVFAVALLSKIRGADRTPIASRVRPRQEAAPDHEVGHQQRGHEEVGMYQVDPIVI